MTNLRIDQGDDEVIEITVKDRTQAPVDLNGWTLWWYVKRNKEDADADALIRKSNGADGGLTFTLPTTGGLAEVAIAPADTAGFIVTDTDRALFWTLQGKGPDDKITTLATGRIVVVRDLLTTTTP